MPVQFFFADSHINLKNRTRLKQFISRLFKREGKTIGLLSYVFCSDKYLLNINRQFLQHDYYTDIVTFDLSTNNKVVDGEIYISIDRIKDNAQNFESSIKNELHRVIFHGALHLCGFKDKNLLAKRKMTAKENEYLELFFK